MSVSMSSATVARIVTLVRQFVCSPDLRNTPNSIIKRLVTKVYPHHSLTTSLINVITGTLATFLFYIFNRNNIN